MARNDQNLIDGSMRTKEEQRKIARMGGIKSGQVRKQKKLMREDAQELLAMPLDDRALNDVKTLEELKGENMTVQQAILVAMIKKAMKGDSRAAEYIRDTSGQPVTNSLLIGTDSGKLADILAQLTGNGEE